MIYAINKKARFEYDILETFEAGLVLTGAEVKSIRSKNIKLSGGFVTIHNNEAQIINMHVPKYPFATDKNYDPEHTRKLLLSLKEINYLRGKTQEKGLTIVPLSLYTKGRRIKLEIGIARGKKQYDKRESIKKRETQLSQRRALKGDYD